MNFHCHPVHIFFFHNLLSKNVTAYPLYQLLHSIMAHPLLCLFSLKSIYYIHENVFVKIHPQMQRTKCQYISMEVKV